MGRVLLLRHGQSEWNAAGRWQGAADIGLTELGEQQALEAGARLAERGEHRFAAIVSSDLARARRTAELLATALGLTHLEVEVEPDLREFDVGEWSGLTRPEIEERWPGQLEQWFLGRLTRTPGGEAREAFVARVAGAVERIVRRHHGGEVLAVSHGGAIGALQRLLHVDSPGPRITNLAGRWFHLHADALAAGPVEFLLDADEATVSPTA